MSGVQNSVDYPDSGYDVVGKNKQEIYKGVQERKRQSKFLSSGADYRAPADPVVSSYLEESFDESWQVWKSDNNKLSDSPQTPAMKKRVKKIILSNIRLLKYLVAKDKTDKDRARWTIENLESQIALLE